MEQSLPYLLASRGGPVVTRDEILDEISGADFVSESNVVDRHIRSLRIKLQNDSRHPRFIATVAGAAIDSSDVLELGLGGGRGCAGTSAALIDALFDPRAGRITPRHDTQQPRLQILLRSARSPAGRPVWAGLLWGRTRPHLEEGWEMALQSEISPPGVMAPGSEPVAPRNLRLLQSWASDDPPWLEELSSGLVAAPDGLGRRRIPAWTSARVQPTRPSAMIVMRQLLDAWRSAERELAATAEGSLEQPQVLAQIATLRSLYQGLFVQIRYAQGLTVSTRLR
jgi:hypothetical protein